MRDPREKARLKLRALYERVAADLAERPGLFCAKSGRCCRFREFGHQLWLTRLEFDEMRARGAAPDGPGDPCPWLVDGLCGNREGRALACRTYFCSDEDEAAAVTERWHREVREIHESTGVPYEYRVLTEFLNSGDPGCVQMEEP